jgi:predicted deacylase
MKNLPPVIVKPPDIAAHDSGNTGIPYAWRFDSGRPGPHVALLALMHGNEYCGAIVLDRLLRDGIRPIRGTLTLIFANVAAFQDFNPVYPAQSRYLEEDMNRVWSPDRLEGPARSREQARAQAIWPLLASADRVLDIHSMLHDRVAMMLAGSSAQGADLALQLGMPGWVVADQGHANGARLIDHPRFVAGPASALLVECGQHWAADTVDTAFAITARFLDFCGVVDKAALSPWLPSAPTTPPNLVRVTETITVSGDQFRFVREMNGMDIIPTAGTLIARDGARTITTPHDDCVLIMPARLPAIGHTAVRLGRIEA